MGDYLELDKCKIVHDNWQKLITNGAYVCRPYTEFTAAWLQLGNRHLDANQENVLKNPSPCARRCDRPEYPISWTALHGQSFHPLVFFYNEHVKKGLPRWSGGAYND